MIYLFVCDQRDFRLVPRSHRKFRTRVGCTPYTTYVYVLITAIITFRSVQRDTAQNPLIPFIEILAELRVKQSNGIQNSAVVSSRLQHRSDNESIAKLLVSTSAFD